MVAVSRSGRCKYAAQKRVIFSTAAVELASGPDVRVDPTREHVSQTLCLEDDLTQATEEGVPFVCPHVAAVAVAAFDKEIRANELLELLMD